MTTKAQAAHSVLGIAWDIHRDLGGDEDADIYVMRLIWLAEKLDKRIAQHWIYEKIIEQGFSGQLSKKQKLRALIEHPATPTAEREAAVQALDRLR